MTRFLVLVKPDGVKRGLVGKILMTFEQRGYEIGRINSRVATHELASSHYKAKTSKPFFTQLTGFMMSGRSVAIELSGDIGVARRIVGTSNGDPGTIRGAMTNDIEQNVVHCSDSEECAERELSLWFS